MRVSKFVCSFFLIARPHFLPRGVISYIIDNVSTISDRKIYVFPHPPYDGDDRDVVEVLVKLNHLNPSPSTFFPSICVAHGKQDSWQVKMINTFRDGIFKAFPTPRHDDTLKFNLEEQ